MIQAVYYGYLEVVEDVTERLNQSFITFKTEHLENLMDNTFEMQLNGIQIMDCCCDMLHDKVISINGIIMITTSQSIIYRFLEDIKITKF